jgi:hypothetical protein
LRPEPRNHGLWNYERRLRACAEDKVVAGA